MEKIVRPMSVMGISLLYKCNFNCEHCGYIYVGDAQDHIIKPGYQLTWNQVVTAVSDCNSFKGLLWNINFTGGEPTMWKEVDHTFMDMLLMVEKEGISPSYNTNGSFFDDYQQCNDFFHKYSDNASTTLQTFISMDKFHKNYDQEKGRALSLDNIVQVMGEMSPEQKAKHTIHIITIVTTDPDSSLPEEMKSYYSDFGISFGDFPMMDIGKAKDLSDKLPDPPEFKPRPDDDANKMVGAVLVGDDYYHGDKKVGKLGHLIELYPDF